MFDSILTVVKQTHDIGGLAMRAVGRPSYKDRALDIELSKRIFDEVAKGTLVTEIAKTEQLTIVQTRDIIRKGLDMAAERLARKNATDMLLIHVHQLDLLINKSLGRALDGYTNDGYLFLQALQTKWKLLGGTERVSITFEGDDSDDWSVSLSAAISKRMVQPDDSRIIELTGEPDYSKVLPPS